MSGTPSSPSSEYTARGEQPYLKKTFTRLLEAVTLLRQRGVMVPLLIAGRPNERVFRDEHIPSDATFIGPVTDAELTAVYDNAAGLVYPSIYEGFGLPTIEAMSRGCPVVVARAGASLPRPVGTPRSIAIRRASTALLMPSSEC